MSSPSTGSGVSRTRPRILAGPGRRVLHRHVRERHPAASVPMISATRAVSAAGQYCRVTECQTTVSMSGGSRCGQLDCEPVRGGARSTTTGWSRTIASAATSLACRSSCHGQTNDRRRSAPSPPAGSTGERSQPRRSTIVIRLGTARRRRECRSAAAVGRSGRPARTGEQVPVDVEIETAEAPGSSNRTRADRRADGPPRTARSAAAPTDPPRWSAARRSTQRGFRRPARRRRPRRPASSASGGVSPPRHG